MDKHEIKDLIKNMNIEELKSLQEGLSKEITEKEETLLTKIRKFNNIIDELGTPKPFRISESANIFPENFYGIEIDRHWKMTEDYIKSLFSKDILRLFHIMYNMNKESEDFKIYTFNTNKIKDTLYEIEIDLTNNEKKNKRKYRILFSFVENKVYVYRIHITFEDFINNNDNDEIITNAINDNLEICYCKNFFGTGKQILIDENNSCDRLLKFIDSKVDEVKKIFNEKINHM